MRINIVNDIVPCRVGSAQACGVLREFSQEMTRNYIGEGMDSLATGLVEQPMFPGKYSSDSYMVQPSDLTCYSNTIDV